MMSAKRKVIRYSQRGNGFMQVFLSHAAIDAPLARRIADRLGGHGLRVWNADTELFPGDNWAQRVGEALEESTAMVVILTSGSANSPYIRREIEFAIGNIEYKDRLIPLYVGDLEAVSQEAPWVLKRMESVRLKDPDDAAEFDSAMDEIASMLSVPSTDR